MPLRTPRARSYAEVVLADGPYSYWRLGDQGIVFFDSGPRALTAAPVGAITPGQSGALANDPGSSVVFAGSGNYIQTRSAFPAFAVAAYTVEAWALATGVGAASYNTVYGERSSGATAGPVLGVNGAAANNGFLYDGGASPAELNSGINLIDSKWHHLVAVNDTTTAYYYIDGRLAASQSVTMSAGISAVAPSIGSDSAATGHEFVGNIQEVAFYTKALSAAQVLEHYRAGTNPVYMARIARNLPVAPVGQGLRRAQPYTLLVPGRTYQGPAARTLRTQAFNARALPPLFAPVTTQNLSQPLSGGLSFSGGGPVRAIGKNQTAGLTLAGVLARAMVKLLVAAALSFSGSLARAMVKGLAASLTLAGTQIHAVVKGLTAGLTLAGVQTRAMVKGLAAGLTLAATLARAITKTSFAAGLTLAGTLLSGKQFQRALTAALTFSGAQSRQIGKVVSAGLTLAGVQARAMVKGLAGSLSLSGTQVRATVKGLAAAGLTLTGSLVSGKQFIRAVTGALTFTGSQTRQIGKGMTGGLTLAGTVSRKTLKVLAAAALTLAALLAGGGALTLKALTAGLTFTGSQTRRVGTGLNGALSFSGAQVRAIRSGLSAGLTLAGTLLSGKQFQRALTAGLTFAGSLISGKQFLRTLTAGLTFTGVQTRQIGKGLAAGLTLAAVQARAIRTGLAAGLSFVGSQARLTSKRLLAGLTTAGILISGHIFLKALTAGLTFTGAAARRTGKALSAGLTLAAINSNRIVKGLAAGLVLAGVIARRLPGKAFSAGLSFIGAMVSGSPLPFQGIIVTVGQPLSRWLMRLSGGRWKLGDPGGRWKNKPPRI